MFKFLKRKLRDRKEAKLWTPTPNRNYPYDYDEGYQRRRHRDSLLERRERDYLDYDGRGSIASYGPQDITDAPFEDATRDYSPPEPVHYDPPPVSYNTNNDSSGYTYDSHSYDSNPSDSGPSSSD